MGDCCLPSLITNPIYIFCLWAHQLVFASIYAYPYVHMYWYTLLMHILDHCCIFSCCCYICTIAAMVPDHTYVCFAYRSDYLLLSIALPLPLLLPRTMFGPCFIYIYIYAYIYIVATIMADFVTSLYTCISGWSPILPCHVYASGHSLFLLYLLICVYELYCFMGIYKWVSMLIAPSLILCIYMYTCISCPPLSLPISIWLHFCMTNQIVLSVKL